MRIKLPIKTAGWVVVWLVCSLSLFADTWYNNYEKAMKAIEKNNWPAAVRYLNAAMQEKNTPKLNAKTVGLRFVDYLPHYYLGLAYYRSGQFDEAAILFEQSLNQGIIQQKRELHDHLERMLADCRVQLSPRLRENQKVTAKSSSEPKDSKVLETVPSAVTSKSSAPLQENIGPTVQTTSPASKAPVEPMIPGATIVDALLVDGAKLYKVGELEAAREKFSAVLQLDARHVGAAKWLKTITLAMGIRDLNQGIRCYFTSDRTACERNLRQVIEVFLNEGDNKSLVVAYQFLAIVLIEKHLLADDPGDKLLHEARQYIDKIKVIEPDFQLEENYFSPKVVKIFAGK